MDLQGLSALKLLNEAYEANVKQLPLAEMVQLTAKHTI